MSLSSHTVTTDAGRLWLPAPGLTRCVRAVLARRCDDPFRYGDDDCFNHYPASPHCTLSWWVTGQGEWCDVAGEHAADHPRQALPRVVFSGPHRKPVSTWCRPPFHGLMLGFRPEAFRQLTGVNPSDWVDRRTDACELLFGDWRDLLQAVLGAADDDERVARIEAFLAPRWLSVDPHGDSISTRLKDWSEHTALRAAMSGAGRSVRQIERRFKQWVGLPQRELHAVGRSEQAFFHALQQEAKHGGIDWSDVAAAAGYADQPHMIRETRRITGFAPASLRERTRSEPAFWMYRLWGLWG